MILETIILIGAVAFIELLGLHGLPLLFSYGVIIVLCALVLLQNRKVIPPFIPTGSKTVETMIRLAEVVKGELVYDLGCGDGRLLIAAAKKGARAIGYEYSLPTFLLAKFLTRKYRTITVRFGDFWSRDYRDADVICCYLLQQKMIDFEKMIWPQLKTGARVISHSFTMPTVKIAKREGSAILYVKDRL